MLRHATPGTAAAWSPQATRQLVRYEVCDSLQKGGKLLSAPGIGLLSPIEAAQGEKPLSTANVYRIGSFNRARPTWRKFASRHPEI